MKTISTKLKTIFLLSLMSGMCALTAMGQGAQMKTQWGDDVKLFDNSSQNQTNVRVSVAYVGWIYTAYKFEDTPGHFQYQILMSRDNGMHFIPIYTSTFISDYILNEFDMVVTGTDTNNLRIYMADCGQGINGGDNYAEVFSYDKDGTFITLNFLDTYNSIFYYRHIAIASDYRAPGTIGSPYSVTLVTVKAENTDSLIYAYSTDGGNSFTRKSLYGTSRYFGQVDIASGASLSASFGRTGIAFEVRDGSWDDGVLGGIGTFFGTTDMSNGLYYDGTPIMLDSLGLYEVYKHPSVSVSQSNIMNNVDGNVTFVTTAEEHFGPGDNDMALFYSTNQAIPYENSTVTYSHLVNTSGNEIECNVGFDPVNNNFLYVLYDTTANALMYRYANFNSPDISYTTGGNFRSNTGVMTNPYPQVDISPTYTQAAIVWSDSSFTNAVAYFDAEFSIITQVPELTSSANGIQSLYPNPSSDMLYINYEAGNSETKLEVINLTGEIIYAETLPSNNGVQSAKIQVQEYPAGQYYIRLQNDLKTSLARFVIVK